MTTDSGLILPREVPVSSRRAPPVPPALKDRGKRSLARWVALARARFPTFNVQPTISFDLRGTTAGRAHLKRMHVQLNAVLFTENTDAFEVDTIPHELAHLIAAHLHGEAVQAHGREWQAIMKRLGLEPRRTHSFDTTNSRTTQLLLGFSCGCGSCPLSKRKFERASRGVRYKCGRCHQYLRKDAVNGAPTPTRTPNPAGTSDTHAGAARLPTAAMLRYATSLAAKHRIDLPVIAQQRFETCREFIDKWAKAVVSPLSATAPGNPVPVPFPTSTTGPTERQVAYATNIAARKKLAIPPEALRDKAKMSEWISMHC